MAAEASTGEREAELKRLFEQAEEALPAPRRNSRG
jgi:hypothetical protein